MQLQLTYDICDCGIAGNANAFGGHLLAGILKVKAHNAMEEQVLEVYTVLYIRLVLQKYLFHHLLTSSGSESAKRSNRLAFHCCITERTASRSNIFLSCDMLHLIEG